MITEAVPPPAIYRLARQLARFRVDVELRAALAEIVGPDDHVPLGVVPREWRYGRAIGAADAAGVFASIGSYRSRYGDDVEN